MSPTTETLVKAGAIVPDDGQAPTGSTGYQARSYHHPALGDRVVVRVVATELAEAEDETLKFLGFSPEPVGTPVGLGRRQALGFPAWAVVHDPDNASAAFAIVPRLERAKRTLRSKPGNAKDEFDGIASRLTASAPRLVPSFYEEAGRAFIAEGNATMAATMFGKARTAEMSYGLVVDEEVRAEAFLEFALAGALSAKALDDYAKTLTASHSAAEALSVFHTLAVQRTLGGLPPTAGMPATLNRLARAAKVDATRTAADIITQMCASPAFSRTPLAFHRNATAATVLAAQTSTDVALALIRTAPQTGYTTDADAVTFWLKMLIDSGATRHLVDTPAQGSLLGIGEPAAWVTRMADVAAGREPALESVLGQMRDRLIADQVPVTIRIGWRRTPLDLLDVALELGIPVTGPASADLDLNTWLADVSDKRDLKAVAADRDHGRALDRAVDSFLRSRPATELLGVPGLAAGVARWLRRRAADAGRVTVSDLAESWSRTVARLTPEVVALDPAAAQAITSTRFDDALALNLRGGILDEHGWPALEDVVDRLPATAKVSLSSCWPYLLVCADGQVWVIDFDRVVFNHTLTPDAAAAAAQDRYLRMVYVDGALLIGWRTSYSSPWLGYWSSDPRTTFELDETFGNQFWSHALPVPGGGVTLGTTTLRRGDRTVAPAGFNVYSDGTTFWRSDGFDTLREFDPVQGTAGRVSLPAFLQSGADQGRLLLNRCDLRPLNDRLIGQWARSLPGGLIEVRDTAGRHFRGTTAMQTTERRAFDGTPNRLLDLPGSDQPLLAFSHVSNGRGLWLLGSDGHTVLARVEHRRLDLQSAGTAVLVTSDMLPMLRPRDLNASTRLRSVTVDQARLLLDAARSDFPALAATVSRADVAKMDRARRAAYEVLGPQAHPRLVDGVLGLTLLAAVLEQERPALPAPASSSNRSDSGGELAQRAPVTDGQLSDAVAGLSPWLRRRYDRDRASAMLSDLRAADRALAREPVPAAPTPPAAAREEVPAAKTGLLSRLSRALTGSRGPTANPSQPNPSQPNPSQPSPSQPRATRWQVNEPKRLDGDGKVFGLLPLLPAIAYRAAQATTTESDREALLAFLKTWQRTDLAAELQSLRYANVSYPTTTDAQGRKVYAAPAHAVVTVGSSRYVFGGQEGSNQERSWVWLLERFSDAPQLPNGAALVYDLPLKGCWGRRDQVEAYLAQVAAHQPLPWSAEAVDRLAASSGLSYASAALILAGLPSLDSSDHNFLDRDLRGTLGLKAAAADTARDELRQQLTGTRRVQLLAAVAGDPARLWDESPIERAERAAAWWVGTFGRQVVVDDNVRQQAKSYADHASNGADLAEAVTAPEQSSLLTPGTPLLPGTKLAALAGLAVLVGQNATVGDPLRLSAGRTLERIGLLYSQPECYASLGSAWLSADDLDVTQLPKVRSPFPLRSPRTTLHDAGPVLFAYDHDRTYANHLDVYLRPALLNTPSAELALVEAGHGFAPRALNAIRWLTGADCAALIDDLARTDLPAGTSTLDPRPVAADIVTEVAEQLQVSENAAALYLQVLALPAPTTRTVTAANGWTSARYKKAAAELVEKGVVVSGKRSRAQRDLFLPGTWTEMDSPDLPLERWKLPLLREMVRTFEGPTAPGLPTFPLVHPLVATSTSQHFRRAWRRILDGDIPGAAAPLPKAGERPQR